MSNQLNHVHFRQFRFTGKNKIGHIHFAFLTGCFQGNFHEAEHWFKKAQVLNKSDHASWTHYGMFSSLQERSFIFFNFKSFFINLGEDSGTG